MNFSTIWHELQEKREWHQLYFNLDQARKGVDDNNKLKPYALTDYERDLIDHRISQLDEALNACNDYYARFLAQFIDD